MVHSGDGCDDGFICSHVCLLLFTPSCFGCVAIAQCSVVYFRSRLLLYSAGSGANRVQVVLSGFSVRFCFIFSMQKLCACISLLHSYLCV